MLTCDEDGCEQNATCACPQCAIFWCDENSGGAGADCPQCGRAELEAR